MLWVLGDNVATKNGNIAHFLNDGYDYRHTIESQTLADMISHANERENVILNWRT